MSATTTASRKAKGRRLQDRVRDRLRQFITKHGLVPEDVNSAIMGTKGVDIVCSPAARDFLKLDIECKNCERLNVPTVFEHHYSKYQHNQTLKLLVHSRNHQETLVTLKFEDLMELIEKATT